MTEEKLREIEERAEAAGPLWALAYSVCSEDVPALVAEVRRLKEIVDAGHDYLRDALGVENGAPLRFDYYASRVEAEVARLGDDLDCVNALHERAVAGWQDIYAMQARSCIELADEKAKLNAAIQQLLSYGHSVDDVRALRRLMNKEGHSVDVGDYWTTSDWWLAIKRLLRRYRSSAWPTDPNNVTDEE